MAWFEESKIMGGAYFNKVKIEEGVIFENATIRGTVDFTEATIKDDSWFNIVQSHGTSTFENAIFHKMESQEYACRFAKMTQEQAGNRALADYHFYREMEAKRKQKTRFQRYFELPVQYIFGYGVKPFRVISCWLVVVIALAFAYWLGHGVKEASSFWENLYFSVVTSATPGYGGYQPQSGGFQITATVQAVFGTFMWAAFIATFARRFMR